jgi:hypothetical protein
VDPRVAARLRHERIEQAQRQARLEPCPLCQAPTLRGLDEDVGAFVRRADAGPVTPWFGSFAYLVGLEVYALLRVVATPHGELNRLDPMHFRSGPPRWPLVIEHLCPNRPRTERNPWWHSSPNLAL